MDKAIQSIQNQIFAPVEGEIYKVKVTKMLEFGAVVEFVPGKDSLLHVSEFDWKRIENPSDVLKKKAMFLDVKYLCLDPKTKKPKVSRKALMPRPPKPEGKPENKDGKPEHRNNNNNNNPSHNNKKEEDNK